MSAIKQTIIYFPQKITIQSCANCDVLAEIGFSVVCWFTFGQTTCLAATSMINLPVITAIPGGKGSENGRIFISFSYEQKANTSSLLSF